MAVAKIVRSGSGEETPTGEGTGISEMEMVAAGEAAGVFDVRRVVIPPGAVSQPHRHPWPQANYILSGRCRVSFDDGEAVLGDGDLVFLPGGVGHGFACEGSAPVVTLCVRGGGDRGGGESPTGSPG